MKPNKPKARPSVKLLLAALVLVTGVFGLIQAQKSGEAQAQTATVPTIYVQWGDSQDSTPNHPGDCGHQLGADAPSTWDGNDPDCLRVRILNAPGTVYTEDFRFCLRFNSAPKICTSYASESGGYPSVTPMTYGGNQGNLAGTMYALVETRPLSASGLPPGTTFSGVEVGVGLAYQKNSEPCRTSNGVRWGPVGSYWNSNSYWAYGDTRDNDPGCFQAAMKVGSINVPPDAEYVSTNVPTTSLITDTDYNGNYNLVMKNKGLPWTFTSSNDVVRPSTCSTDPEDYEPGEVCNSYQILSSQRFRLVRTDTTPTVIKSNKLRPGSNDISYQSGNYVYSSAGASTIPSNPASVNTSNTIPFFVRQDITAQRESGSYEICTPGGPGGGGYPPEGPQGPILSSAGWLGRFAGMFVKTAHALIEEPGTGETCETYYYDYVSIQASPGNPNVYANGQAIFAPLNLHTPVSGGTYNLTFKMVDLDNLGTIGNGYQSPGGRFGSEAVIPINVAGSPDFAVSCTPATQTITAGGSTSFNISTTPQNGFNNQVNFVGASSPSGANAPSIDFVNNNRVPPATTTALITTTSSTTPATYTLTFTGSGGGQTHFCQTTLTVDPNPPPTAWITANGSAGSITIPANSSAIIDWGSANATSCTATPATLNPPWNGVSGSQSTGPLTQTTTYTASCTGPGGTANGNVVVNVQAAPDFTLSCTPPSGSVVPGGTTSFNLSTTPLNGFNSPVSFNSFISPTVPVARRPSVSFQNNDQVPAAVTTAVVSTTAITMPRIYAITFSGTGGGITKQCVVSFEVLPTPLVILYANGQPDNVSVPFNGTANLTWTSENATSCTASGDWSGSKALNNYPTPGENQNNLTTNKSYTLTCTGPGGQSSSTVTVTVGGDPADFTILCTPPSQTITIGGSTSFNISTTPQYGFNSPVAISRTIDGPLGAEPPIIGFVNNNQVPPGVTTSLITTNSRTTTGTYYITYTGTGGGKVRSCPPVMLQVNPEEIELPPSVALYANGQAGSTNVAYGGTANLTWTSENATSCTASGDWSGSKALSNMNPGENQSNLTTQKTYILTCNNSVGSGQASVTVMVGPQPPVPDFLLACVPPTQSITVGGSTSFNISTTPQNGFNSPVVITHYLGEAVEGVTPPTISYINNNQVPPATTTALVNTNGSTTPATYTITFTGTGGGKSRFCQVSLTVSANPPPTTWITANGSSGSITVPANSSATIAWGSANATSCSVTSSPAGSNWTGTSGSQSTGPLTQTTTYTSSCTGPGGSTNANVVVNVLPGAPQPPASVRIDVSTCAQATINWTASPTSGITGYYVYRSTDGSSWGSPIATTNASTFSHTDYPPLGNYYYAVSAYNAGGESTKRISGPANVRACVPNISTSDKDIIAVAPTGISSTVTACNGVSDPVTLNGNRSFKVGDVVTFRINICNTGDVTAQGVQVYDSLSNLSNPTSFNYSSCSAGSQSVSGSNITFTVGDVQPNTTCRITFSATVTKPATGSIYRFQNIADITPSNMPVRRVLTPAYLFTDSAGNPDRNEIAP